MLARWGHPDADLEVARYAAALAGEPRCMAEGLARLTGLLAEALKGAREE